MRLTAIMRSISSPLKIPSSSSTRISTASLRNVRSATTRRSSPKRSRTASTGVANIIREGHTEKIKSYIQSGREQGMITMDNTLKKYLEEKLITGEEAFMFAQDKTMFEQHFSHDVKPEAGDGKGGKKPAVE